MPHRRFDDDDSFLALWEEAQQAAGSPAPPTRRPPSASSAATSTAAKNDDIKPNTPPPLLAQHLGLGGHGPLSTARLSLLVENQARSQPSRPPGETAEETAEEGRRTVPRILPAVFFGDLRAGDAAFASESIELCRSAGVQAFSLRYLGGEGEEGARRAGAAAADSEWEDVSVCLFGRLCCHCCGYGRVFFFLFSFSCLFVAW